MAARGHHGGRMFLRGAAVSCAIGIAAATLVAPAYADAQKQPIETARLPDGEILGNRVRSGKPVVGAGDAERYRRILRAQAAADWPTADREIARLQDRLLMGHVLAQRLLHPARTAAFAELESWLRLHHDHPDARAIHRLAVARAPTDRPDLPEPTYSAVAGSWEPGSGPARRVESAGAAAKAETARIREAVAALVKAGKHDEAVRYLSHRHVQRKLDQAAIDIELGGIAADLIRRGNNAKAAALADKAAKRSAGNAPAALWSAGLAAFRLERYDAARRHFETLAEVPGIGDAMRSAAAFWAARANIDARRPENVKRWLYVASEHPYTFYGLIAHRILGIEPPFTWDVPAIDEAKLRNLKRTPAVRRAFALLEIGAVERADLEFRGVAGRKELTDPLLVLALADEARLAPLALRAAGMLAGRNVQHDAALYPIPGWEPARGFVVDRALVYAFMRQESAFEINAVSRAGAQGLMQIMPATAAYIGAGELDGRAREAVYDPILNVELGQRYLRYLLDHEAVQGNLIMLAAAYNGGPGNLAKWRNGPGATDDPLLFVESIPIRETRVFVQRVLANYWIYQMRLGQPTPSLDALAAGESPLYSSPEIKAARRHARN